MEVAGSSYSKHRRDSITQFTEITYFISMTRIPQIIDSASSVAYHEQTMPIGQTLVKHEQCTISSTVPKVRIAK